MDWPKKQKGLLHPLCLAFCLGQVENYLSDSYSLGSNINQFGVVNIIKGGIQIHLPGSIQVPGNPVTLRAHVGKLLLLANINGQVTKAGILPHYLALVNGNVLADK